MTSTPDVEGGRFEPSPYDLGITEDPEVTWAEVGPDGEIELEAS
jgi:hypothetical protein